MIEELMKKLRIFYFLRGIKVRYTNATLPAKRKKLAAWYPMSGYPQKLGKYKDIHKNDKRCFIIGNGPSLKTEDLDMLKDEITFSCNKIYKILDKTVWKPYYYVVDDWGYVTKDFENIKSLKTKATFVGIENSPKQANPYLNSDVIIFRKVTDIQNGLPQLTKEPCEYIGSGHTVLFPAFQLAAYMGFKEIYFIGVDCSYSLNSSNNYFYETDKKEVTPEIVAAGQNMFSAFASIRQWADENGVKVYNATRGGKLEEFERVNFDSLFGYND